MPTTNKKFTIPALPHVRSWSAQKRMAACIEWLCADPTRKQVDGCTRYGVSAARVSNKMKAARDLQAVKEERSAVARAERVELATGGYDFSVVEAVPKAIQVAGETRRIEPFVEFHQKYFGQLQCPDCNKHHDLPDFHREIMEAVTGPENRLMVNIPPYHAKSTIITVMSTVYELCRDPNSTTIIVSGANALAKKFLYSIQRYLTDERLYEGGPNLIQDWGPFRGSAGEIWSQEMLYVAGRMGAEKDPSVEAKGYGTQIYGARATRVILDDIADLKNQRNPERVTNMLSWIGQEASSRVGRTGKLIAVGTRVSPGDIYYHLAKLPGFKEHTIRYPCILDEGAQLTLWPDHYPFRNADLQRQSMDAAGWQLVYQNIDTPGIGASFTAAMMDACRDKGRSLGEYSPDWFLVAGLDPAGANRQSGYTSLTLLGIDMKDGKRHIVDAVNAKQMKAPQMRDQIFEWAERYPLRELRVESNGLQSQLVQYNDEILGRMTSKGIRVVPHITGANKWNPEFGVEAMSPMFYNRMISIPWGDARSKTLMANLEDQLCGFPMHQKSDMVMSLWFAELAAREAKTRADIPFFDMEMKVPAYVRRRRRIIDFGAGSIASPTETELAYGGYGNLGFRRAPKEHKLVNVNGSVTVF